MAKNLAFHMRCVKEPLSLCISFHGLITHFCLEINFVLPLTLGRSVDIHSELVSPPGVLDESKIKTPLKKIQYRFKVFMQENSPFQDFFAVECYYKHMMKCLLCQKKKNT